MKKHTSSIFILIATLLGGNYLQSADNSGNPPTRHKRRALRRVGTETAAARPSQIGRAHMTRHSSPALRAGASIEMAAHQENISDRDRSGSYADALRDARSDTTTMPMGSGSVDSDNEGDNEREEDCDEELSRWDRCKQRLGCCFKTTTGRLIGYTTAAVITLAVSVYLGNYFYDATTTQGTAELLQQLHELKSLLSELPSQTGQYVVAQVGQTLVKFNGTIHDLSSVVQDVLMPLVIDHAEKTGQSIAEVTEMLRNGTLSVVPTANLTSIETTLDTISTSLTSIDSAIAASETNLAALTTQAINQIAAARIELATFVASHP